VERGAAALRRARRPARVAAVVLRAAPAGHALLLVAARVGGAVGVRVARLVDLAPRRRRDRAAAVDVALVSVLLPVVVRRRVARLRLGVADLALAVGAGDARLAGRASRVR